VTLKEVNFALRVTRLHRRSLDRVADLIEREDARVREQVVRSLDGLGAFDVDAIHELLDAPLMMFSFYALSIVHCYSLVENNRRLVCERIPGITPGQQQSLHDLRVVKQCLERTRVSHERLRCFKTMDEFRVVNNAVKHQRVGLATSVVAENGRTYSAKQLRALYKKAAHLETYLSDLYRRVVGRPPPTLR
jgi:hypothetical protein